MADKNNIYKFCDVCKGTGKEISPQTGTPDCNVCKGVGKVLWGEMIEQEVE